MHQNTPEADFKNIDKALYFWLQCLPHHVSLCVVMQQGNSLQQEASISLLATTVSSRHQYSTNFTLTTY